MNVFVSWATVTQAEAGSDNFFQQAFPPSKKGATTVAADAPVHILHRSKVKLYLPEYSEYLEIKQKTLDELDLINADILAIQFVIPALEKVVTYQLAKRVPGDNKLSVSLAARSFLLNTFSGEWDNENNSKRVVFIGLAGLKGFMQKFAYACAVLGQALPLSLWRNNSQIIELIDQLPAAGFINACANNAKLTDAGVEYYKLVEEFETVGIGASAARDSSILLAIAFKLGFGG